MRTKYQQPLVEGGFYHIYNRAVSKARLFYTEDNYDYFMHNWQMYLSPYCDLIAYCLIPNHFHFVVRIKPIDEQIIKAIKTNSTRASVSFLEGQNEYYQFLEAQFQRFFLAHALAIRKQEKRKGALFQKGFKRVLIKTDERLVRTIAYVHHNPIHHLLGSTYTSWEYSSYKEYLKKESVFINRTFLMNEKYFDFTQSWKKQYKRLHKEYRTYFNPKIRFKDQIIFE